jgi:hypothetical protein
LNGPMAELWEAVMARGGREDVSEVVEREGNNSYDMRIVGSWLALGTTFEELQEVLHLLRKAVNFTEIRALSKLYIVSWITLADVVAVLINQVFDLGYHRKQIELGAILQNEHIAKTSLPTLVTQHGKDVQFQVYSERRNDIVHRGTWRDPEFDALQNEWLMKTTLAVYMIDPAEANARELAASRVSSEMNLTERIHAFLEGRTAELQEHLASTLVMLNEIGAVLAARVTARVRA